MTSKQIRFIKQDDNHQKQQLLENDMRRQATSHFQIVTNFSIPQQ